MSTDTFTFAELEAAKLLHGAYWTGDIHSAANEIIELAERIKAQRAIVAMRPVNPNTNSIHAEPDAGKGQRD